MLKRILLIGALLLMAAAAYYVTPVWREISMMCSEDPAVWEDAIADFAAADEDAPPPDGAVLFVGSSTIRLWETLAEDMAPLPLYRRGFGGAKVNDVLVYANRIITNYRPSAVVVYVGGNDVTSVLCNEPKPAERIAELTRNLIAKIHAGLPAKPVYYVAIKPTSGDDGDLERAAAVNVALRDTAATDELLFFIDANDAVVGTDGRVRPELLKRDGVHLNREGYALWAPVIRERLLADSAAWGSEPAR